MSLKLSWVSFLDPCITTFKSIARFQDNWSACMGLQPSVSPPSHPQASHVSWETSWGCWGISRHPILPQCHYILKQWVTTFHNHLLHILWVAGREVLQGFWSKLKIEKCNVKYLDLISTCCVCGIKHHLSTYYIFIRTVKHELPCLIITNSANM